MSTATFVIVATKQCVYACRRFRFGELACSAANHARPSETATTTVGMIQHRGHDST
jgi:hypothetical protein